MCTVTYLPIKNGFVLTSSRDEKIHRPTLKPKVYKYSDSLLIYPKDKLANGTWIAANNKHQMACLLNGAFENHEKKYNYTKSRGQILLDCFLYKDFSTAIKNIQLKGVEPFTLLLIEYKKELIFRQLVWDEKVTHIKTLPNNIPQIWSSATLYSKQDREVRKKWFSKWIEIHRNSSDLNILNFHTTKHGNTESNDIIMKRENDLQTVSVSQLKVNTLNESFLYHDLLDNNRTILNLSELVCTQE